MIARVNDVSTLVVKFGGTSVGTADAISAAVGITSALHQEWGRVVCVVSAMSGVTDQLVRAVSASASGDTATIGQQVEALRARHVGAAALLALPGDSARVTREIEEILAELASLCHSVAVLREATPRARDAVVGLGERLSCRLVAAALNRAGTRAEAVDATDVIVTDDRFGDAAPLAEPTRMLAQERLGRLLEERSVPVVTGFIGATESGALTTLGRGGSDYSAAIIGAAIDAGEVWIYTDVDGVMTADPRVVPSARVIPSLSYAEVGELAYFGAKVLHPRTIRPVIDRRIPLRIRNTFNAAHPGTLITGQTEQAAGTVKAVTSVSDLSLITVEGRGMIGIPGVAARTFGAVAAAGANVLMISQASSEQSICFVVPRHSSAKVVKSLDEALAFELHRRDIDRVWAQDGIAIVSAVGAGMRGTPGVASRIFGELGEKRINIIAIAQGSSECSVSMVVDQTDRDAAVRAIHALADNGSTL